MLLSRPYNYIETGLMIHLNKKTDILVNTLIFCLSGYSQPSTKTKHNYFIDDDDDDDDDVELLNVTSSSSLLITFI